MATSAAATGLAATTSPFMADLIRHVGGPNNTCADEAFGYPQVDGFGLGPVVVPKYALNVPVENKVCTECPECERRLNVMKSAAGDFSKQTGTVNGVRVCDFAQNGGRFGALVDPTATNGLWSVIGGGATSQACFGHTFDSAKKLASCAGLASRLPYFCARVEDIFISSCGDQLTIRAYNDGGVNFAGVPYPQRYSWNFQLRADPGAAHGFYISKMNALIDSELTLVDAITVKDPFATVTGDTGYVCPVIGSRQEYEQAGTPLPTPYVNMGAAFSPKPVTVCPACASCAARQGAVSSVAEALVADGMHAGAPVLDLLADDGEFSWHIAAQGPTEAACMGTGGEATAYTTRADLTAKTAYWGRIAAMTQPGRATQPVPLKVNMASCGDKVQVYITTAVVGSATGTRYTISQAHTMYLKDAPGTAAGFVITRVETVGDTEVLMNMAEREQAKDTIKCPKLGAWTEEVSHTTIMP